jgi:hypothetical protein
LTRKRPLWGLFASPDCREDCRHNPGHATTRPYPAADSVLFEQTRGRKRVLSRYGVVSDRPIVGLS